VGGIGRRTLRNKTGMIGPVKQPLLFITQASHSRNRENPYRRILETNDDVWIEVDLLKGGAVQVLWRFG
jgi:hypothetical protein